MERRSIAEWEREFGIQYQTLVYVARRAKIHQGKSRGSGMVLLTREQAESLLPQVEALEELRWRKRSCYSGARFGKLTVTERGGSQRGHQRWICRCDCGEMTVVIRSHLTNGVIRSCGAPSCREYRKSGKPRKALVDSTGQRFGSLVVVGRDTTCTSVRWVCRCDCGAVLTLPRSDLHHRKRCGRHECKTTKGKDLR